MEQEAHVLIFPLPVQGHVNSMLKLAELISLSGLQVTFLNSDYNHQRLLSFTDVQPRFARFPGFSFKTISDGLPPDYPRSGVFINDLFDALQAVAKPLFKELITTLLRGSEKSAPLNCIIADGAMLSFTVDVAEELRVPIIAFRTISACCFWAYFCFPKLVEAGELPFSDDHLDTQITCIPEMENLIRRRDLPSFCRAKDLSDPLLQTVIKETLTTTRASALILNTFEQLEGPILSQIRTHCPTLYTIGPLHAMLNTYCHRPTASFSPVSTSSNSLWEEDRSCMSWLDSQPLKSVVYVSFGSLAVVSREELMEFWHGLVNSRKHFLWVIRPDLVAGEESGELPEELREGTKKRGYMVEWAPQEEVLGHPAVAAFLTHSGWNSTLESVYAGVPMICWPYFADQQVNSRFVGEVWKNGLDMKDSCDRVIVANMVTYLLDEDKGKDMRLAAEKMAREARRCISGSGGGSSYANLAKLIRDITTNNLEH